jgi:hypothetical protein
MPISLVEVDLERCAAVAALLSRVEIPAAEEDAPLIGVEVRVRIESVLGHNSPTGVIATLGAGAIGQDTSFSRVPRFLRCHGHENG